MSNTTQHTHIRRAAEYIAEICVAAYETRIQSPISDSFRVLVEFDAVDVIITDDTSDLTLICDAYECQMPIIDLQNIEIEVLVAGDSKNYELEVDSHTIVSSDPSLKNFSIVKINAHVPTHFSDIGTLRTEIVASIVHEMRHSIQHIMWGWDLIEDEDESPETHIMSNREVDARVEEICSYSKTPITNMKVSEFEKIAKNYLWGYIKRNFPFDVELETAMSAHKTALKSHIKHFKIRRDCDEFTCPTE
jgi:hypothetical protein